MPNRFWGARPICSWLGENSCQQLGQSPDIWPLSGFKTSVTPASERSLHPPESSRQCGYCQQSLVQPQKVRKKGKLLAQGGGAVAMANDGRGRTKANRCVLGCVCPSAGSFAGVLAWLSQLHSHVTDEDAESQRPELIAIQCVRGRARTRFGLQNPELMLCPCAKRG